MTFCPECKHFIYCDWGKMILTKISNEPCKEFEKDKEKK